MTAIPRSALFEPVRIRQVTARNRVWVSPMCQYSATGQDGIATAWHHVHLGSFARGGAGIVFTEATAVNPRGRISSWDLGLWNQAQRDALEPIVSFIHDEGALAGIQLAHAGRKASTYPEWIGHGPQSVADGGWLPVAPSAIPFGTHPVPEELTADQIAGIVDDFGRSVQLAVEAGFDVIELHAAHGYLLHEFLSPLSNRRTDRYGGSLENRARALLEAIRAVRRAAGEATPVLVRFSGTDWAEGGWTIEETATVAGWAVDAGADWFDVSSGGLVPDVAIPLGPGYQVPLAAAVKRATGAPVNAVGLITDAGQAEQIVASGDADAVMLARALLREPHFALLAADELGAEIDYWPPQYRRARPRRVAG